MAYTDGFGSQENEVTYPKMRYPNGEGPWADWSDVTGAYKVKARYLTHDESDVELLLEGGKKTRMARAKLAKAIETELAKRPILTRRPDEVEFDVSKVDYESLPAWTQFGADRPPISRELFQLGRPRSQPKLHPTTLEIPLSKLGAIDAVVPVGGEQGWIAIGVSPTPGVAGEPASLQWLSTRSRSLQPGPKFFEGEVVLSYSAEQQRLLTAEGLDLRGSATRFCTYRIAPGEKKAKPEWKWSVPKLSFFSSKNELTAEFVGEDRILIGYGATVTLWNMTKRQAEYAVPSTHAEINLSPDHRYFGTNQYSRSVVVDTATGLPVAQFDYPSGKFSRDGRYLLGVGNFSSTLIDLTQPVEPISMHVLAEPAAATEPVGSPSLIGSKWFSDGSRIWDLDKRLPVWTYAVGDLTSRTQTIVDDKLMVTAIRNQADGKQSFFMSVTEIPHPAAIAAIAKITPTELYLLRPDARVRIDNSVQDPRMLIGIRKAIAAARWVEDPSSAIVIKASAGNGPRVTTTFSRSRFGGSGSDESVSVSPWLQRVSIEFQQQSVWATGQGGLPAIMVIRDDSTLQQEANKYTQPAYTLFEELQFPDKVLAPKWKYGFGTTLITPQGLIDHPVAP